METSARLLRLLSLLERNRGWNSDQLAGDMGVTTRTVRRDIARLRDIGYPVETVSGPGGGYALRAGVDMPPMMFEADEAVATMLALQLASDGVGRGGGRSQTAIQDAAASAMEKMRRLMPTRLRKATESLLGHTTSIDLGELLTDDWSDVPVDSLLLLTAACRDRCRVTCRADDGRVPGERTLEPLHLVRTMGHWYLHAYCLDSHEWTTPRVDELIELRTTTKASTHRPPDDVRDRVVEHVTARIRRVNGSVRVHAPLDAVLPWIAPAWGTVTAESESACVIDAGADTYDGMARWLMLLDTDITVLRPPELAQAFGRLGARARRASRSVVSENRE